MSETLNVIVFGEAGVGKSSLINLIIGNEKAETSSSAGGCTRETQKYQATINPSRSNSEFPTRTVTLWDTIGLHDPRLNKDVWVSAALSASQLITGFKANISLLVFCLGGGRMTANSQAAVRSNHQLFYNVFCREQVPIVFIITHLESEPSMDGWWSRNEEFLRGCDSVGHACVTTYSGQDADAHKVRESEDKVRNLIYHSMGKKPKTTMSKRFHNWATNSQYRALWHLALRKSREPGKTRGYSRNEMMAALQERCKMSQKDARYFAEKLVPDEALARADTSMSTRPPS